MCSTNEEAASPGDLSRSVRERGPNAVAAIRCVLPDGANTRNKMACFQCGSTPKLELTRSSTREALFLRYNETWRVNASLESACSMRAFSLTDSVSLSSARGSCLPVWPVAFVAAFFFGFKTVDRWIALSRLEFSFCGPLRLSISDLGLCIGLLVPALGCYPWKLEALP